MTDSIILVCKNLSLHLRQAQKKMGTDIPVIELDTSLHKLPVKMREKILEEIADIPEKYRTILVAMGFCGGSWKDVRTDRRVVIPRIDDCISLLLATDDSWIPDRKTPGCMYLTDNRDGAMTIPGIRSSLLQEYGEEAGGYVFDAWFSSYERVSIIDTGVYDSYDPEFLKFADYSASLIDGSVEHVPGSNRILEKLVTEEWDDQFMILEPGMTMSEMDLMA